MINFFIDVIKCILGLILFALIYWVFAFGDAEARQRIRKIPKRHFASIRVPAPVLAAGIGVFALRNIDIEKDREKKY